MGRTEERISGLEDRTMENAPTWTAERKRRTKGPAEPHGPVTLRWRSTSGIAREETEGRAGRNDAETPPRGGGHAPWAPRSHGRGPRHRGAGASAGSASLRRLVLLATCLRSVYGRSALGATEDTAQPGRWRPCSQHGLLGTLSPSLRPAAQKKIPFKTCLPLDRAPGPARAPRLQEAVRNTHGRLRRRPMRDTAGPAPAFGSRGSASEPRASHRGRGRRVPDSSTADTRQPRSLGHRDTRHHPCGSRHGGVRNATAEWRPRQEPHEPRAGRTRGAGPRGPPQPGCRRGRGNTVSKAPGGGLGPRRQRKDGSNGSLIRNYCLGYSGSFVGSREF